MAKLKRIFWDKGHGGKDPGAADNGLQEKVLVHKIVEYAMAFLLAYYTGFVQKTSRTGDTYPTLPERAKMSKDFDADVFVSVHINAASGKGNGYESYVYNKKATKESRELQNSLNTEILAAMRKFGDIKAHGGDMEREANLSVLRNSYPIPGVLTENLYIDSSDHVYLQNEEFLKAVGHAHAVGVANFLGLSKKDGANNTTEPKPVVVVAPAEKVDSVIIEKPKATGDSGMKSIQVTLNTRYATGLAVDGVYGPATKKALVKGLQTELNKQYGAKLAVDGIFGRGTVAAVVNVSQGARGNITWILQAALYALGYDTKGVDGVFGSGTTKAVKAFQKNCGLSADGIAGKNTFNKLLM
ncbi:N-acetylmuramoyl-L-alanine amidase [Priestia aryabhattai]|uniref:N-acetylmuramoyl-L-alanine amidase n=1 Tax=Priestia aryabhattai TaxID=412384 RepID=A0ABD7X2R9_PRIAR|nr:N-acetylmuramoyl-L-alanine amidase [Priestia aryabhattai]WEA46795.1 N-acetylmuramoyl-L-alanine amidase [Priestia aryabhattai]